MRARKVIRLRPQQARFGLACSALICLFGCEATIESGLQEQAANEIIVALHDAQIGARKEEDGGRGESREFRVTVPIGDVDAALERMRAEGLPRRAQSSFESTFGEGGLVPTATEERARFASAIGGELATSIETIDGVLEARVHVALPDARRLALDEARPSPRASVLVRHRGAEPPYDEDAVRSLVAGAVPDLDPAQVAIVGVAAPPLSDTARERLVSVGPIAVTRGSAGTLKAVLGGALLLHLALAALLVLVVGRRRRAAQVAEDVPTP